MVQTKGRNKFAAGAVSFVVQHELWDGNIQDHSDQGVVILVEGQVGGKDTTLLRFNCFDIEKSYSKAAFAAGADLILGHHAHVPKAIGVYDHKVCLYSLGNFIMSGTEKSAAAAAIFQDRYGVD